MKQTMLVIFILGLIGLAIRIFLVLPLILFIGVFCLNYAFNTALIFSYLQYVAIALLYQISLILLHIGVKTIKSSITNNMKK
jgi:hypothetical protein